MWGNYGGYGWDGMMGGMGGIGLIGMVLFWVLIIAGIVVLVKWLAGGQRQQSSEPRRDTALEVLKKRYARGDIGREEYEQKTRDLNG